MSKKIDINNKKEVVDHLDHLIELCDKILNKLDEPRDFDLEMNCGLYGDEG